MGWLVVWITVAVPAMVGLSFGVSLLGVAFLPIPPDAEPAGVSIARAAAVRIGLALAVAGGATLGLLPSRRRLPPPASSIQQLGIVGCALWAAFPLAPLVGAVSDLVGRLGALGVWSALASGGPLSGLALLPALAALFIPALALLAAVPLTLGGFGQLLLARAASPRLAGACAASAVLAAGSLVACFFALELARTAMDAFAAWTESEGPGEAEEWRALLDAVPVYLAGFREAALGLIGPCVAAMALAAFSVLARRDATAPALPAAPPPPALARPTGTLARPVEQARGFERNEYRIRLQKTLFTASLRTRLDYEIAPGLGDRPSLRARRDALSGVIRVTRVADGTSVLEIRRRAVWPRQRWQVFTAGGEALGELRRQGPLAARWTLLDPAGQEVASVRPTGIALRWVRYEVVSGGRTVCTCEWSLPSLLSVRPHLDVDFGREGGAGFDRRLGVAIGLVLEPHARYRAHVYAS